MIYQYSSGGVYGLKIDVIAINRRAYLTDINVFRIGKKRRAL